MAACPPVHGRPRRPAHRTRSALAGRRWQATTQPAVTRQLPLSGGTQGGAARLDHGGRGQRGGEMASLARVGGRWALRGRTDSPRTSTNTSTIRTASLDSPCAARAGELVSWSAAPVPSPCCRIWRGPACLHAPASAIAAASAASVCTMYCSSARAVHMGSARSRARACCATQQATGRDGAGAMPSTAPSTGAQGPAKSGEPRPPTATWARRAPSLGPSRNTARDRRRRCLEPGSPRPPPSSAEPRAQSVQISQGRPCVARRR